MCSHIFNIIFISLNKHDKIHKKNRHKELHKVKNKTRERIFQKNLIKNVLFSWCMQISNTYGEYRVFALHFPCL